MKSDDELVACLFFLSILLKNILDFKFFWVETWSRRTLSSFRFLYMIMSECRYSKADTSSQVKKRAVSVLNFPCLKQLYCYRKLVKTFHNVSKCKTKIYFGWLFILQLRWSGDLDCNSFLSLWPLLSGWADRYHYRIVHVARWSWPLIVCRCFTLDRLRITLSNRDRTRLYKTFIITIVFWLYVVILAKIQF